MRYIDKPQQVWWRKILFQVHLWVGIILGIYIIVIGLSGSILVFREELAMLSYPELMKAKRVDASAEADLISVINNARAAYPQLKLTTAYRPGVFSPTFFAFMEGPNEQWLYVFADAGDGHIRGALNVKRSWLFWVSELHFRLLAGRVGLIVNGIGAGFLVLLCLSGLLLWWPGLKRWPRALKVNFRRGWKRINFDLHSAVGFCTLTVLFMWALSGVYFVWPDQFESLVNRFSSVAAAQEPKVVVPTAVEGKSADLENVFSLARNALPAAELAGIFIPEDPSSAITVYMARGNRCDFSQMDQVYFDPSSGKQLALWHAGVNPTLGSKFIHWLGPLHFGMYWGLGIKILWAALGLSLPLLTITGALMYWNRSLSGYWARLKANSRKEVPKKVFAE